MTRDNATTTTTRAGAAATALLLVAAAGGCTSTDQRPAPTAAEEIRVPIYASSAGGRGDFNMGTHLNGAGEVFVPATVGAPTPADSKGQGEAIFRVSADGQSVDFRLIASNIDNVIMSHIHCGLPTVNGPIRMWLYPVIGPTGAPAPSGAGRHDGVLATGTFHPAGVVCPASAVGQTMPLLDAMRAGLTYVNVHTNDGIPPINTGPGDFPGGEIRGQLDRP